jgi:hypothetical protein
MPYTLITKTGKIMCFYIKGLAKTYQVVHGGVIITSSILVEKETALIAFR